MMTSWPMMSKEPDKAISASSIELPTSSVKRNATNVYFFDTVTTANIINCIEHLTDAAKEAKTLEIETGCIIPVSLFINSPGGSAIDAFALTDHIKHLQNTVKVNTIVQGLCASSATLFSIVGNERYITENSYMLLHQISAGYWGKYNELKDQMVNFDTVMQQIKNHYHKYTSVTPQDLNEILEHDLLFNTEKSLQFKLIDKIY